MLKISKIPENIKNKLIIKKVKKKELLSYGENGKVGYLVDGKVQAVRYQSGNRLVFPGISEAGDFLGLIPMLLNTNFDFELETKKDSIVLEIPITIFKKYILSNPKVEIELLKNISSNFLHSTRGFFIRTHGGAKAYLAYLLYFNTEEKGIMRFEKLTEIGELIFSGRYMIYKIIKEFERANILEKGSKILIIKDREKLKDYFEEYIYL